MSVYLQALNKHRWRYLRLPGVVGVGVGYKVTGQERTDRMALAIFVREKLPLNELPAFERIPLTVDGVITDVVPVGEFGALATRTSRWRPAPPGVSIGHYRITAGTLGAVVLDQNTREQLILSNNHILANATDGTDGRAKIGDPVVQPGPYDGGNVDDDTIGHLSSFIPISFENSLPICPIARYFEWCMNILLSIIRPQYHVHIVRHSGTMNLVDAAVATPVRADMITPALIELGIVNGTAAASLGQSVSISGRTSGVSKGTVTYLHSTVTVNFSGSRTALFEDQVLTDDFSDGGDSGSLVVDNNNHAVGLLFAGSTAATIFNPIEHVTRLLKVAF